MKVKVSELNQKEKDAITDALYAAADMTRGKEAARLFLKDLLTESERIMLGRRILIARMLLSGASFGEISERLRVGQDTVLRVDTWLSERAPGYEGLSPSTRGRPPREARKKHWSDFYRNPTPAGALALLKRKYPLYFLLFPWPKGYELPKGW